MPGSVAGVSELVSWESGPHTHQVAVAAAAVGC